MSNFDPVLLKRHAVYLRGTHLHIVVVWVEYKDKKNVQKFKQLVNLSNENRSTAFCDLQYS